MSLTLYEAVSNTSGFSTDGTNSNAIRHSVDGRLGGTIERLYYLRNDDVTKFYREVTMIPVSNPAKNIVSGTNGYSIKFHSGATQPTSQEWASITPANEISLANITDTNTYIPIWVRIDVPRGAPVDTITNTVFRINATEFTV